MSLTPTPSDSASPTLRSLQSAMPVTDEFFAYLNSVVAAGEEEMTIFLRERKFGKNTSLYASVPLSKWMTFARAPDKKKPGQDLKERDADLEHIALIGVIDLVEVCQPVDLSELLEFRVLEESVALFNSNGTYGKTQKSRIIQKLSLQPVGMQEPYIALIHMGLIWRTTISSAENRQKQAGTPHTNG